ncbi:MAG: hypothetical protein EOO85_31830, partial [Pedobacter sp.]
TITGFFLFLSGLITGYYENKIITHQIPKRIREHKTLLNFQERKQTDFWKA